MTKQIHPYFEYTPTLSFFNDDKELLLKKAIGLVDELIISPDKIKKYLEDMDNLLDSYPEEDDEDINVFISNNEAEDDEDEDINIFKSDYNDKENTEVSISKINWITDNSIRYIKKEIELDKSIEGEKKYRLNNYINQLKKDKPIIDIPDYNIFNEIMKKAPHCKEAIDYYKGNFILNHFKMKSNNEYKAPLPLLLLGDPGIGKTYFAKELAKLLNTTCHMIDANSVTASWILTGSSGQWRNSEAGLVFQQMLSCNTVSPIIIFDEIDKLSIGKNYDPFSAFHQLLEPENSKSLKDEYINCDFNASYIIYILTANDANSVPESLLSRMKVININQPDAPTTHMIAQNIYKEIVGESGLFKSKLNTQQLIQLENLTPRKIKHVLSSSVSAALSKVDMTKKVKMNRVLEIKNEDIKKRFGFV